MMSFSATLDSLCNRSCNGKSNYEFSRRASRARSTPLSVLPLCEGQQFDNSNAFCMLCYLRRIRMHEGWPNCRPSCSGADSSDTQPVAQSWQQPLHRASTIASAPAPTYMNMFFPTEKVFGRKQNCRKDTRPSPPDASEPTF